MSVLWIDNSQKKKETIMILLASNFKIQSEPQAVYKIKILTNIISPLRFKISVYIFVVTS